MKEQLSTSNNLWVVTSKDKTRSSYKNLNVKASESRVSKATLIRSNDMVVAVQHHNFQDQELLATISSIKLTKQLITFGERTINPRCISSNMKTKSVTLSMKLIQ